MKKIGKILTAALLVLVMVAGLVVPGSAAATPKNVIVIVADGVGYNQYLAADYYLYGKAGASLQEKFPVKLAMSTYSHGQSNVMTDDIESVYNTAMWKDPLRFMFGATDSASAATAMSTGVKTNDACVGTNQDGAPIKHMLEDFEALGKSTGVVTNVPFAHATPAGFSAHNSNRNNYDAIGKEQYNSALEVIMGCGHPLYDDDGQLVETPVYAYCTVETWNGIKDGTLPYSDANGDGTADPWTYIQEKADFEALTTGATPDRVFGIAKVPQTTQEYRQLSKNEDAFVTPFNTDVPDLVTMAKGALNVLDNNKNGFYLMIEAGATDWCGHFGQSGRLIEEMKEFYDTVSAVCAWVEKNSSWNETLLVVTGDHETGYLTGTPGALNDVVNNGKGVMPKMTWNMNYMDKKYAGMVYWHSNVLIPFFAKGVGSENFKAAADLMDPIRGNYLDNTEISVVIRQLMGVSPSSWAIKNVYLAVDRNLVPFSMQKNWTNNITRNEFCTLAFELLKKQDPSLAAQTPTEEKPNPFTDTTSDVVYTLNQLGIIGGKTATTFNPNDQITRQEAAVLVNNLATYLKCAMLNELVPNYADSWAIADWAKTAVDNAYKLGVMKSTGNNNFSPLANFTVEQAICAMLELYKLKNTGDIYVWDVAR